MFLLWCDAWVGEIYPCDKRRKIMSTTGYGQDSSFQFLTSLSRIISILNSEWFSFMKVSNLMAKELLK